MSDTNVLVIAALLLGGCAEAEFRGIGRIDRTRAFYYPAFAKRDVELARVAGKSIDAETYTRYLCARFGTRYLEDLAFDLALERECAARGLARSALVLARSTAAMRYKESGRVSGADPERSQQRKFANEALRKFRVDAIVAADRSADDVALRQLFDRRYGVGGERVEVRQILVSFRLTRRRLGRANKPADEAAVRTAARNRATELRRRLDASTEFAELVAESDDRATQNLLQVPASKPRAGFLPGYNYQRYGEAFANAVRTLTPEQVSEPIASDVGYHLIQLVGRTVTELRDVEARLRQELRRGSAKPTEIASLRQRLLENYGFTVPSGHR